MKGLLFVLICLATVLFSASLSMHESRAAVLLQNMGFDHDLWVGRSESRLIVTPVEPGACSGAATTAGPPRFT